MASFELKKKGGYDHEFVNPPPKSLECPVCLLTLRDPHVISCCGNEFCQMCIERVQRDGKPCPLCNEPKFTTFLHKKLVREVNALVVCCPQKELGCDWQGELGRLQSHLNPGAGHVVSSKGCGFVLMECAYQCGTQLQRRLLQEHEMEVCPKRPMEMQVASLMRKFEIITIENQQLKQELNKVKEINEHLQKECDELKHATRAGFDEQNLKFDDLEKKCVFLQMHTMPLTVPPFYFSITNVDHYQSNNISYQSGPFYSHPGGYKMCLTVHLNGSGDTKGTHVSVYVYILRGEFDDHLRWPFDGRITVQIYNRTTEQWSNDRIIIMNEKCCGLKNVDRCVNALTLSGWGCNKFLSLSELKADYVKKLVATIRFRVSKVEICDY